MEKNFRKSFAEIETACRKNFPANEKLTEAFNVLENDSESSADEILDVMNRIAETFIMEENFSEAAAWRERAWNFCRENFLEDAPETLRALRNLIGVYEDSEDYDKIELYRRKLHAVKEKNLGAAHIEVILEKENIADTLHEAGKYDDELELRKQIVKLYRENFSANAANKNKRHWNEFIRAMNELAFSFDEAEQESEALGVRKQIVDERKNFYRMLKKNSAGDKEIIRALEDVIDDLNAVDDSDEELFYRLELVNFCREKNANSDDTLEALGRLATFYREHERTADEFETLKEIVGAQKNRLQQLKKNSADDEEIIDALNYLAHILNVVGDSDEELFYRLELVNFCREKNPQSDDTRRALKSLADFYSAREFD